MKAELNPTIAPRRGTQPKIGNVYSHARGKPVWKIVVGHVAMDKRERPWNNVVLLHVNLTGDVVSCSREPEAYVRDHQDLVGYVKTMPTLKVEWLKEGAK